MADTIFNSILLYLLRIALAWGVLWLGRYLARHVRAIVQRLVSRPHAEQVLSQTIGRLLVNITFYSIFGAAIALALIVLGVPVSYVLGLSSVVFILAAISLQQSLEALAATVIFFAFQPFRRGEVIETLGQSGVVQEVQLFNTVILNADQRIVSLSNSEIQTGGVVNHTRNGIIRNQVNLTVSYQVRLDQVRQIILEIIAQDGRILSDPPPSIAVQELADQGVRLNVFCMSTQPDGALVTSDLREQIKSRFDAEGIAFARQQIYVAASPDAGNTSLNLGSSTQS